jgi:hypothetical protein
MTSTGSSWLNLMARRLSQLTAKNLRQGRFANVRDLLNPRPFV